MPSKTLAWEMLSRRTKSAEGLRVAPGFGFGTPISSTAALTSSAQALSSMDGV